MRWRRGRFWIAGAIVAASTVATLSAAPTAGAATDPLVGYWRNPSNGGLIQVVAGSPQFGGAGFTATVTVAYPAGNGCTFEVGRFVWQAIARQADGTYTGTLQGFSAGSSGGCPASAQTFTIRLVTVGGLPTLQLCTTPFSCTTYLWSPFLAPTTTVRPVTTTTTTRPSTTTTTTRFGTTTTTLRPGATTSTARPTTTLSSTTTTTIKRVAAPGDFPQGYWLVHATGHQTLNGPVKDDVHVLIGSAPDPNGNYRVADGSGGVFHYTSDFNTGPLYNKEQVCAAAAARGLPQQSWSISYYRIFFDCRPATTSTTKARPTATTAPRATTTSTPAIRKDLVVTSSLPPRMGTAEQPDGATTPEQIRPSSWSVDLKVRVGRTATCLPGPYTFIINQRPAAVVHLPDQADPCTFRWQAPAQGTFDVNVATRAKDGVHTGTGSATVRDMLIVGLGDSNGSGEGNPPWADTRCHRSAQSFQSLAARQLQKPDQTVTFVHLACSGASINEGMVRPYRGLVDPGAGQLPLPSQISDMETRLGGRTPDAVIISIGINDYGFGAIVGFCVWQTNCPQRRYPSSSSAVTLDQYTKAISKDLENRYRELASRLVRAKVQPRRVYLTQYFDPTWNALGTGYCNPLIDSPAGDFDQAEAQWASQQLLAPLNAAVVKAAGAHGWNAVTGAPQRFRTHGYCAGDGNRWIVQFTDSVSGQIDYNGTLHANLLGNRDNAAAVAQAIRPTKK